MLTLTLIWVLLAGMVSAVMAQDPPRSQMIDVSSVDVVTAWYDLAAYLAESTPGFSSPVATRSLGYLGITLNAAVMPGMLQQQAPVGQLNEIMGVPQPDASVVYHWPIVANAALARITRHLFTEASGSNRSRIDLLEGRLIHQTQGSVGIDVLIRSREYGRRVADAIYKWSTGNGQATTTTLPEGDELPSTLSDQLNVSGPIEPGDTGFGTLAFPFLWRDAGVSGPVEQGDTGFTK